MNPTTCPNPPAGPTDIDGDLAPPPWAQAWVADSPVTHTTIDGAQLTLRETPSAALLTARWSDFASLPRAAATQAAEALYLAIAAALPGTGASITGRNGAMISSYSSPIGEAGRGLASLSRTVVDVPVLGEVRRPVRFWNHIPGIHHPMGDGMDRYMAFNAGRFAGFSRWLGSPSTFPQSVATASGIGHFGADLIIHVLASRHAGVAVHNPRQTSPMAYSQRFGPRPPCFARATLLPETGLLLIGGTASIRGEESTHAGDLAGQLQETFANLDALIHHAGEMAGHPTPTAGAGAGAGAGLASIHDLRVYHPRREDAPLIRHALAQVIPAATSVQFVHADLCRRELLVEIEGLAQLRTRSQRSSGTRG